MKNSSGVKAPPGLSPEARRWWRKLVDEYDIRDGAGFLLLLQAMEALDRLRQCQAAIAEQGATLEDRFGQLKPHPLLTSERDARSQLLQALRALNLDVEVA